MNLSPTPTTSSRSRIGSQVRTSMEIPINSPPAQAGQRSRGYRRRRFLAKTIELPATYTFPARLSDLRQSMPDLRSRTQPAVSRRRMRSYSVAIVPERYDEGTHPWLEREVCPDTIHRALNCGSRKAKRGNFPGLSDPKASTIHQHYYPEGGWGWIVLCCALVNDVLACMIPFSIGFFILEIRKHFKLPQDSMHPVIAACTSSTVSLLLSPVAVAASKRRSIRLLAVLGGILIGLGSLFTSFASQLHQLYLSCGLVYATGEALVRDTAGTIFGQYFKRRRHQVEIIYLAGYGLGIATLPLLFSYWLRTSGWTRTFQILAGTQLATCFISVLYRPASLYHPQRRAILHIKSLQKRSKTTKDKTAVFKENKIFMDYEVLKSKTVKILIFGTAVTAFGITAPFTLMIGEMKTDFLDLRSICQLQVNFGLAVTVGAIVFGLLAAKNNAQCLVAKQYLCQATTLLLSGWFIAYPTLNGFHGYVLFVWVYGVCYAGYIYSLKLCVFEKVRARNFARAWSFVLFSQALPSFIGIPVIYYLNQILGSKRGYYVASAAVFLGSLSLFLIDVHKNNIRKKKQLEMEQNADIIFAKSNTSRRPSQDTVLEIVPKPYGDLRKAQELTCISEEILVDNCIEDYIDDCITSCNKEEKFLMLSEFENNLFKTEETLEKERACDKDCDTDSGTVHYCAACFRTRDLRGSERLYSPRRMMRTISNIDVIDEVTSL